jgi:hypothetical protein
VHLYSDIPFSTQRGSPVIALLIFLIQHSRAISFWLKKSADEQGTPTAVF